MAFSIRTLSGDGSSRQYPVNFTLGFLKRSDVTCRVNDEVDGTGAPLYRELVWINDGLVEIQGIIPGVGEKIVFTRNTNAEELQHDFDGNSALTEKNLDESHKQAIMLAHQIMDGRFVDPFQVDLDLDGNTIQNVRDPVDPLEVANRQFVLNAVSSGGNVPSPIQNEIGYTLQATAEGFFSWRPSGTQGGLASRDTVDTAHIEAGAVETDQLNDGAVTTDKVADDAITNAKIHPDVVLGGPSVGASSIIRTNAQNIAENVVIPGDVNGTSAGNIVISDGSLVTCEDGGSWTIL